MGYINMKSLKTQCDELWRDIIIMKAGFKSELSGLPGKKLDMDRGHVLQAHHIARKPNYRLRYELENGICVTRSEHQRFRGRDAEIFRHRVMELRGHDIYDRLYVLRWQNSEPLPTIQLYLEQELRKLKELQCLKLKIQGKMI